MSRLNPCSVNRIVSEFIYVYILFIYVYIYGMHTYTKRNEERIWEALRGNEKEKRRRERQRN